jgi:hypothetical protein
VVDRARLESEPRERHQATPKRVNTPDQRLNLPELSLDVRSPFATRSVVASAAAGFDSLPSLARDNELLAVALILK